MNERFSKLSTEWLEWTALARIPNAEIAVGDDDEVLFKSREDSYRLRLSDNRWTIDEIDDRGHCYSDTASFSNFILAEKYLIWRWASTARTALGVRQLGAYYHSLGVNLGVQSRPASRANNIELQLREGTAIVPESSAAIFSHVLEMSLDEIDAAVRAGI
jgi:hypothetical protein